MNFLPSALAMDFPTEVFPVPGRTDETEDRSFHVGLELAHRQVFQDALLHFLQVVMIFIQDFLGLLNIQVVRRWQRSREVR